VTGNFHVAKRYASIYCERAVTRFALIQNRIAHEYLPQDSRFWLEGSGTSIVVDYLYWCIFGQYKSLDFVDSANIGYLDVHIFYL
jgi:hypothetical protein